MHFLDYCKSDLPERVWMWGTVNSIQGLSYDPWIQEWLDEWNSSDGHKEAVNEVIQTLIYRKNRKYILQIREIMVNDMPLSEYVLDRNQCEAVLRLMLKGTVFNHEGIEIEF